MENTGALLMYFWGLTANVQFADQYSVYHSATETEVQSAKGYQKGSTESIIPTLGGQSWYSNGSGSSVRRKNLILSFTLIVLINNPSIRLIFHSQAEKKGRNILTSRIMTPITLLIPLGPQAGIIRLNRIPIPPYTH